ncbi:hypothetical protein [Brucella intermedia]|nr:hypothetical protein [Brucella intermedia]
MRHSKYAPSRFIEEARPALQSFADGSTQRLLEGVEKARAAKVASSNDEVIEFLRNRKFSASRANEVVEYVEKEEGRPARTIWDLAQGISAVPVPFPTRMNECSLSKRPVVFSTK